MHIEKNMFENIFNMVMDVKRNVITHFWVIPQFTFFSLLKKIKTKNSKNITVKRGCQNAKKRVRNWLRRFKNTKIKI
jgi:hypothetical protein